MINAGVSADRITTIRHGVDHISRADEISCLPDELRNVPFFLYVGNLEPRKNLGTLLNAFDVARSSMPDNVKLVVVGNLAWGEQPVAAIQSLLDGGSLLLAGYQPDNVVRALIRGCISFVYPSSYEGFGLPPLEALQLGAPVIAGDNPAGREVLGEFAHYVAPGSIEDLSGVLVAAAGGHLPRADSGQLESWLGQFRWGKAAELTVDVYRSAAA
jgi:alpha-1,3-rhamnosyl/mannosyltransferase